MTTKEKSIILKIKRVIFENAWNIDYKFFLFGSRVNWTAKKRSDYDIWVIWEKKLDPLIRMKIEEWFENIPALIDFIDFSEVSESFSKIAKKNILWLKK